jgi:hypothetical protein
MDNQIPTPTNDHQQEHQREHEGALERAEPRNRRIPMGVLAGGLTAGAFGLLGYLLLILVGGSGGYMGTVIFLCLPFAAGFVTALVARHKGILFASLILGVLICFAALLASGKEGFVCVLMAVPLIAVGLAVGAVAGFLFRKYVIDRVSHPTLLSLLVFLMAPLFLMGANTAEEPSRRSARTETVTNTLVVDASPERVWNEIKSIDSVNGSKPFLMMIGLPVPTSCVLQGEGVGGKRICYFDSGSIEERITEWNPPASMKVEVTASNLPGTRWLSFKDASYEIKRENGRTLVTRSTTIVSRLAPAWYWTRLEDLGVETEHKYLFEEIKRRINGAK